MVRFILKRKYHDEHSGMQSSHHETILCDVPELQAAMCRGGHSEMGYDVTEFVGISIEDVPAGSSGVGSHVAQQPQECNTAISPRCHR